MANYINKVIYGGDTLIDLTQDDVSSDKVLAGVYFHLPSGERTVGQCTYDSDTSGDDALATEVLLGKTFHARGMALSGTMPNRGSVNGIITTLDGVYTIPNGYHDGSGTVAIDASERSKIVASNIRQGVTILGVEGTMSASESVNAEIVTVTPTVDPQTITPSAGYNYISQVNVGAISYVLTNNSAGGQTATIASVA